MEETIKIEKTYTKKEAFEKIRKTIPTASEAHDMESEYNKLVDFCGIRELI